MGTGEVGIYLFHRKQDRLRLDSMTVIVQYCIFTNCLTYKAFIKNKRQIAIESNSQNTNWVHPYHDSLFFINYNQFECELNELLL